MNSLLSRKTARLLLLVSAVAAPVASGADSALTAAKYGVFKDPLHYTSPQEPDAAESAALDSLLTRLPSEHNPRVQAGWIEDFIAARPDSGWTPSLCFQLGEYYRDHGRYSLALARWEAAFSALTNSYTPQANTARGYVVRSLARLYLQLGREDRIGLLLDASTAAPANDDTITRDMTKLREDYGRTAAFREKLPTCAAAALSKYAAVLRPGDTSLEARILNSPGKQQGLSLLDIVLATIS